MVDCLFEANLQLAATGIAIQVGDCLGKVLKTFHDFVNGLDLPCQQEAREVILGLRALVIKGVHHPELGLDVLTFQFRIHRVRKNEVLPHVERLLDGSELLLVESPGCAEGEDAPVLLDLLRDLFRQRAADTVGVEVDAIWKSGLKLDLEGLGLVIKACIEAEMINNPLATIRAACKAD